MTNRKDTIYFCSEPNDIEQSESAQKNSDKEMVLTKKSEVKTEIDESFQLIMQRLLPEASPLKNNEWQELAYELSNEFTVDVPISVSVYRETLNDFLCGFCKIVFYYNVKIATDHI